MLASRERLQHLVGGLATGLDGVRRLGRGVGWLRVGGGALQVALPGLGVRMMGLPKDDRSRLFVRTRGLRELVTHIGLLRSEHPAFAWMRLAGDLIDLGVLASHWNHEGAGQARLRGTIVNTLSMALADGVAATRHVGGEIELSRTVGINRTPAEIYRFWRHPHNLARFMAGVQAVERVDDTHMRWTCLAPNGKTYTSEVEIVDEAPDKKLVFRVSQDNRHEQIIILTLARAPGNRGTNVTLSMHGHLVGGAAGAAVATLFGESPEQKVMGDLRRLKQVLETGEVVHSDASIHRGRHPAQPSVNPPVAATTDADGEAQSPRASAITDEEARP